VPDSDGDLRRYGNGYGTHWIQLKLSTLTPWVDVRVESIRGSELTAACPDGERIQAWHVDGFGDIEPGATLALHRTAKLARLPGGRNVSVLVT
jgi:hypothetical protein